MMARSKTMTDGKNWKIYNDACAPVCAAMVDAPRWAKCHVTCDRRGLRRILSNWLLHQAASNTETRDWGKASRFKSRKTRIHGVYKHLIEKHLLFVVSMTSPSRFLPPGEIIAWFLGHFFPPGEKLRGGNNDRSLMCACKPLFTSDGNKWLIRQLYPLGEKSGQIWTPLQALFPPL